MNAGNFVAVEVSTQRTTAVLYTNISGLTPRLYVFDRSTRLVRRSHQVIVKLVRCNRKFYGNSLWSHIFRLWNTFPASYFLANFELKRLTSVNSYPLFS